MAQSPEQNKKVQFLNFTVKAVFFMLKTATMSESKPGRMQIQKQ